MSAAGRLRPVDTGDSPRSSIEELIERAVSDAIIEALGPHLRKLAAPEPLVYTVAQAAEALQVSPDTVARLVKRGLLDRVPHLDGKTLIPRISVEAFVSGQSS